MITMMVEIDETTWGRWHKIAEQENTTIEEILIRLMYHYEAECHDADLPHEATAGEPNRFTDWQAYF